MKIEHLQQFTAYAKYHLCLLEMLTLSVPWLFLRVVLLIYSKILSMFSASSMAWSYTGKSYKRKQVSHGKSLGNWLLRLILMEMAWERFSLCSYQQNSGSFWREKLQFVLALIPLKIRLLLNCVKWVIHNNDSLFICLPRWITLRANKEQWCSVTVAPLWAHALVACM